eukprot:TRINITY_DN10545_c0_g1_i1.p1 TRINITY_DN10545_c0_g1~~TRINITY_DN10545_c0_g1_i1.p1  ORF type:complete len:526 (-),score=188.33 TRINITY_DN10545_c0_g1_i1:49-1626(-)
MSEKLSKKEKWENVQKKAFLHWINTYLHRKDESIADIQEGFADGIKLIMFLELLTGTPITDRYTKNPRLKVHKINNNFIALKHLENLGVYLTIAAENLADADPERINLHLGFCWMLLRKFQNVPSSAGDEESKSNPFEERLLDWVKNVLSGYDDISISNFKDFSDGKALLALLETFDSSLVDYQGTDKSDAFLNCTQALTIAEDEINIPMLLEADELAAGEASDKSVVLYLTLLYNAFSEKNQVMGTEQLLERIEELEELYEVLSVAKEDLDERTTILKEENTGLNGTFETLTVETSELQQSSNKAREDWTNERAELLARIEALETQLGELKESAGDSVTQLQETQDTVTKERDELKQAKEELEDELEELQEQFEGLTKKFKKQQKAQAQLEQFADELKEENTVSVNVLRKHLLCHINDMVIWKKFLETDLEYDVANILGTIKTDEEIGGLEFPDQVKALDFELEEENDRLGQLLAVRINERQLLQEAVGEEPVAEVSVSIEEPAEPKEKRERSSRKKRSKKKKA